MHMHGNKGKHQSEEHKKKIGLSNSVPFLKDGRLKKDLKKSDKWYAIMKGRIPWNKGKPHLAVRGDKNPLWKGGITPKNKQIRHSLEYKIWHRAVFERDDYTCIWCGARSGNGKAVYLHADHIKPFAEYPELRFAIDNGRTLCRSCHEKTDTYKKGRKH